ncbi:MAG: hypothetical protein ACK2T6_01700 [Anaerolineae bacterium]
MHASPRLVSLLALVTLLAACSAPTAAPDALDAPGAGAEGADVAADTGSAADDGTGTEGKAAALTSDDESAAAEGSGLDVANDEEGAAEEGAEPSGSPTTGAAGELSTPLPPPTEASTEPISAITSTLTYEDPTIGYAIDYPETWSIDSFSGSIVTLLSVEPEETSRGGLLPGDARIDIVPDLQEAGETTLPQLVALTREAGREISREDWELDGGIPAVRLHLATTASPTGEALMLLTVIDGRGIRVQGFGDLTLFDAIARSLRPAGQ